MDDHVTLIYLKVCKTENLPRVGWWDDIYKH